MLLLHSVQLRIRDAHKCTKKRWNERKKYPRGEWSDNHHTHPVFHRVQIFARIATHNCPSHSGIVKCLLFYFKIYFHTQILIALPQARGFLCACCGTIHTKIWENKPQEILPNIFIRASENSRSNWWVRGMLWLIEVWLKHQIVVFHWSSLSNLTSRTFLKFHHSFYCSHLR